LATDRNLIKRRMREIYRQNKHRLLSAVMDKRSLSVALVYVASDKIPYTELENKLNKVLLRLIRIAEV
jgi:ribonuclease P protein component